MRNVSYGKAARIKWPEINKLSFLNLLNACLKLQYYLGKSPLTDYKMCKLNKAFFFIEVYVF